MRSRCRSFALLSVVVCHLYCGEAVGPPLPNVADIRLAMPGERLLVGEEFVIEPRVLDGHGQVVSKATVSWKTSAPSIVAIDSTGKVTGIAVGSSTVVVTAGDFQRTVVLHVVHRPTSCDEAGTDAVAVREDVEWRTADGPHHIRGVLPVQRRLRIQKGALVCGSPGAILDLRGVHPDSVSELSAVGTPEDSIVFTAREPGQPWGGVRITLTRSIEVAFIRFQHAANGFSGWDSGSTRVSDAVFRQIGGVAIGGRSGAVTRVRMDTIGAGLNFASGGLVEVADLTIHEASGTGIHIQRSRLAIHNTAIINAGVGIRFQLSGSQLESSSNVMVANSRATGVQIDIGAFTLHGFTVTNSGGDGVVIGTPLTGFRIHQSNFVNNGGVGVRNNGISPLDAAHNWWGDPAGPAGPVGDGVAGPVNTAPHLSHPAGT